MNDSHKLTLYIYKNTKKINKHLIKFGKIRMTQHKYAQIDHIYITEYHKTPSIGGLAK